MANISQVDIITSDRVGKFPGWSGRVVTIVLALGLCLVGREVAAQTAGRLVAVDLAAGWAGFLDNATKHHAVVGASLRFPLLERLSVGPEVVWMRGPDSDRDLLVTGNVTFDWFAPGAGRPITPFLVVGGGLFRHSDRFPSGTFTSTEGGLTAGGGIRARVSERVSVGGEGRVGWEPHLRLSGFVAVDLR